MNTKKMNAGIAFLCLHNIDNQGAIPEDLLLEITNLADRSVNTDLCTTGTNDEEVIKQCIALIQDYLRSVSTDINIGDRVEVLEDSPDDSDTFYDQGEVGIVVRMLEGSCIVQFEHGEWDSAEIPFSSLKRVVE